MKLLNKLMLAALILSMAIAFNSCGDDTTGPDDPDVPVPTGLKATSIDVNTIRVIFEAPGDLDQAEFKHYEISYYPENEPSNVFAEIVDDAGAPDPVDLAGLDSAKVYTIEVRTVYNDNSESNSISMNWAPSTRFERVSAETIKLYENSSSLGSGLDLFDEVFKEPASLSVSNYDDWNVGVFIDGSGPIIFGSANSLNFNNSGQAAASAEISKFITANGLNDVYDSEALDSDSFDYQQRASDITSTPLNGNNGMVVYLRVQSAETGDYNYAKVFIKSVDQDRNYLRGSSPNRYIEVEISYQTGPNLPYAKR